MGLYNRQFTPKNLEETVLKILVAKEKGDYNEIMEIQKWLRLMLEHTDATIHGYTDRHVDMTGAAIKPHTSVWENEVKHFKNKRKRLVKARDICEKHSPFEGI